MILYHGTLESLVPEILRTGLQPRGERPSHDAYMDSASMPPFLYLTSSFGIAVQHAVRISERVHQGAPISVFEIDTKVLKLALRYPDEDYLREEWNSDFTDWTLKEQLAYMEHHQDEWRESLKMMKVIAYKGVIKPSLLRLAPVPRWMEDGYRKRLPRKVNSRPYEENHQAYGAALGHHRGTLHTCAGEKDEGENR